MEKTNGNYYSILGFNWEIMLTGGSREQGNT